jgi:hypothetical protein
MEQAILPLHDLRESNGISDLFCAWCKAAYHMQMSRKSVYDKNLPNIACYAKKWSSC